MSFPKKLIMGFKAGWIVVASGGKLAPGELLKLIVSL